MESGFAMGTGVKVSDIQRAYDDFLQSQLSKENTNSGFGSAVLSSMEQVEQLFNDLTTDGLGQAMQDFFDAWQDLTANPQGQPERQAVLSMGQQLVDQFQRINSYLNDVKTQANKSLEGLTSDINDMSGQIASLNEQIQQIEIQGGNANELRDQRDLVVRELSAEVGITYIENGDGTLSVSLTLGQPLVIGNQSATLSLEQDVTNSGFYKIMATSPGGTTAVDISTIVGGPDNTQGEMGGTLQVRDTLVNGFLSDLDELAYTLANEVNSIHETSYGLDGVTGRDFFTVPSAMDGYSGLGGISLAVTTTSEVAAADSDPLVNGTGNNNSATAIADIYDTVLSTSGGNMTLEGFFNSLVGKVGVAVQDATRRADQSDGILQQLDNLRESNSGVSLDEELANLVKYQKAYEGAAKLINVGTEMMDTILGLIN